jgi:L-seryl-tRNA(Ser) seleniumtransferase
MPLNPLRNLPSVHALLESSAMKTLVERISRNTVVSAVRTVLDEVGHEVQTAISERTLPNVSDLAQRVIRRIVEGHPHTPRPIINATGGLWEDRFGRAPLAEEAIAEMAAAAQEYVCFDEKLAMCGPGSKAVEDLLRELTGAEAALVVNNTAGAIWLAAAALASGREMIVSRGQLVDLGGCCLSEMIAAAGVTLCEVGSTNATQRDDYAQAVGDTTAAILLVQPSNFAIVGATQSTTLEELIGLGQLHKFPVIHYLDSGAILDMGPWGFPDVPVAAGSVKAGADLVLLNGDKLLGGPQCGILLGRKVLLEKIAGHPMARALGVDKLTLAALAATLAIYRNPEQARLRIPVLRLLGTSVENLKNRAERLAPQIAASPAIGKAEAVSGITTFGWCSGKSHQVPTWCVAVSPAVMPVDQLVGVLQKGFPSVVGIVDGERLLLDLRSVFPYQDPQLVEAFGAVGRQEDSPSPSDLL